MTDRDLAMARGAVERFNCILADRIGFDEDLAREYNRLKKALAVSFQAMSLRSVPKNRFPLAGVKADVVQEMRRLFSGRVDSALFAIKRYNSPHAEIYALLAENVGQVVPGWRIRLLSGDKIHTERRTRELRDLGLAIDVTGEDDESRYCLTSLNVDLRYGAAFQLRENALRSKKYSGEVRAHAVALAERTAALPPRKGSNGQ